jgi:UDP-GlcNAc:undecaprenyl-phosphate GlcNAc-1-phosphate transferase
MPYLSTLLLSTFITIVLIPVFGKLAVRFKVALDMPDVRKVHGRPIPRVGGLAIILGVYGSIVLWGGHDQFLKAYTVSSLFIVVFGVLDDIKGLDFRIKFLAQLVAALVVVIYGGIEIRSLGGLLPEDMLLPAPVAIPLTVVAIVGVTNAVNLADGLDGLAGGVCLLSFCCLAYLAHLEADFVLCLLSLALAGSIFGFLRYNTYPAELFMGDTGSQFLGFSAIVVALTLTQGQTPLSPLLPLLILGFPVLDTLAVMAQRFAEKRPLFAPDKNHFHHKLIGLGFFHTESVLVIYIVQAMLISAAFLFRFYSEWFLLAGYVVLSAIILTWFHVAESTGWKLRRHKFLDVLIKGRLRQMRERGVIIRVCFRVMQFGIPLLLFATCFVPYEIPRFFSVLSAALLVALLIAFRLKARWMRTCLMVILYLFIPFIVSLSVEKGSGINDLFFTAYNLSYVALVIFVVLTLKFTRRQEGFKTTPMDFLILFIALVVPHVLSKYLHVENLATIASKTVMFYFSYEVLMGELRGRFTSLAFVSMLPLALVIIRGLTGW